MLPSNNIQSIVGATLHGLDGDKIGKIAQVLVDAADGHPTWAVVHVGTITRHAAFVPLREATWEHDDVSVPFTRELVKTAPRIDSDGLSPAQEQELERHYAGSAADGSGTADPNEAADTHGAHNDPTEKA
ncbi:MAG: PRC-barrel domain-containing protein [Leifsonia sp.]